MCLEAAHSPAHFCGDLEEDLQDDKVLLCELDGQCVRLLEPLLVVPVTDARDYAEVGRMHRTFLGTASFDR